VKLVRNSRSNNAHRQVILNFFLEIQNSVGNNLNTLVFLLLLFPQHLFTLQYRTELRVLWSLLKLKYHPGMKWQASSYLPPAIAHPWFIIPLEKALAFGRTEKVNSSPWKGKKLSDRVF